MISRNLKRRLDSIPVNADGEIADFAILIEMHQDNDGSVQQFRHAFVRGESAPVKVDLDWHNGQLGDGNGNYIPLRPMAQKFMTIEAFQRFVTDYIMTLGESPLKNGVMPTRYLRDARKGVNRLQSFRQVAMARYMRHLTDGTLVKP